VALPPRPTSVVLLANLALTALERSETPERIAQLAQLALSEGWLIDSGSFQFAYAGEALMFIDRLAEAKTACDAAVEAAQRRGSVMLSTVAHGLRSNLNVRRGAVAEAEADARISYQLSVELTDRGLPASGVPFGRAHLANALIARGEWDEAGRVLADAEPDERAEENPFFLERRGWFRLEQGDAAAAITDFLECGRSLERRGGVDTPSMLPWRSSAALALLQVSDEGRATELASEELVLSRKQQVTGAIAEALIVVGIIEGGEQGIRRLREAVDILRGSPRVLTRIRALTELGSMLRRNRERQAARAVLVTALDLAHRHGATALAHRAREELVIAGGRPRRPAVEGVEALTPSERRVADFAAQGLTNRQIAGRLFISARTVSAHLTPVYQKLGVVSRADLSARLEESV
jgi:DNA-binding CsgD family transcriptional regulator/tetratricopeptide (TPR) repeat protein